MFSSVNCSWNFYEAGKLVYIAIGIWMVDSYDNSSFNAADNVIYISDEIEVVVLMCSWFGGWLTDNFSVIGVHLIHRNFRFRTCVFLRGQHKTVLCIEVIIFLPVFSCSLGPLLR